MLDGLIIVGFQQPMGFAGGKANGLHNSPRNIKRPGFAPGLDESMR